MQTQRLERIEAAYRDAAAGTTPVAALADADWELRQAALHAVRRHPTPDAAAAVYAALRTEDARDVYGQTEGELLGWGAGHTDAHLNEKARQLPAETLEAWKCRWRGKQAACLALGTLAAAFGAETLPTGAIDRLATIARDRDGEDYQVRAAACEALSAIGTPTARDALRDVAEHEEEFCTLTQAKKGLG